MTHHFSRDSVTPHKGFTLCGKHIRTILFVHPDADSTCVECQTIRDGLTVREFLALGLTPPTRKEAA